MAVSADSASAFSAVTPTEDNDGVGMGCRNGHAKGATETADADRTMAVSASGDSARGAVTPHRRQTTKMAGMSKWLGAKGATKRWTPTAP
jgi:hypothetical protein